MKKIILPVTVLLFAQQLNAQNVIVLENANHRIHTLGGSPQTPQGLGLGSPNNYASGIGAVAIGDHASAQASKSISIGDHTVTFVSNSYAFGSYVRANATNAFIMGAGPGGSSVTNSTPNSLMINFGSTTSTLFVGQPTGTTANRVGINNNNPEELFQVKTGAHNLTIGSALYPNLSWGTSYIGFGAVRTSAGTWKAETDGANNGAALMYGNVQGDLFFSCIPRTGTAAQTGITDATILSNTRFYISSGGGVGVGTRCVPWDVKLAVNGKILCEELHVKLSDAAGCWPDYVFGTEHKRLTLPELEQYIRQNKHLPNVPSADEVDANGVDVMNMEKILLEKIEEMSLYIIELNKEIEKLKAERK